MRFARNKNGGKNGQKRFCPSTKTPLKRAKTIMPVRYKNSGFDSCGIEIEGVLKVIC